jgi:hypothetical protein
MKLQKSSSITKRYSEDGFSLTVLAVPLSPLMGTALVALIQYGLFLPVADTSL